MRLGSILTCAATAPLLVAAAPPVHVQPSSQWVVDYDDDSCRLVRTFDEGKNKTTLVFESVAPGEMTMLATGQLVDTSVNRKQATARFLPVQQSGFNGDARETRSGVPAVLWNSVPFTKDVKKPEPPARSMQEAVSRNREFMAKRKRPDPVDPGKEARDREEFTTQATALEIESRRGHPVVLETGSMGDAIKALDQCGRDMLKFWGLDPEVEARIVRPAWIPQPWAVLNSDDYPKANLVRGEESTVEIRLLIDAAGRVTKCTPLSHFDAPGFNTVVCNAFLKRAKFQPAELADGTKVPGFWAQQITFRIENGPSGYSNAP